MKLNVNSTQAERDEFVEKLKLKLKKLDEDWHKLWDETYERDVHQDEFDEIEKEMDKINFGIQMGSYKKQPRYQ